MSEGVISNQKTTAVALPSSVRALFQDVRRGLRRYAVVYGLLVVAAAIGIVFWVTTAIDSSWFALQRLELPVGLRTLFLIFMIVGGGWLVFQRVLRPSIRRIRDTDVALLLEKRFPEFGDRLMTTIEGVDGYPDSGALVGSMLERTAGQADVVASHVEAADVFDPSSVKKSGWLAGAMLLSILLSAFLRPGSLQRWWSAFVLCEETYQIRTTALEATVIAQPGDRRLAFSEHDGESRYLHPRGADLELELRVPDGDSPQGQPWVVPDRVRVDVIREDGTRSRAYVSATSGRTFRFILTRLQENVRLEVLAGDYRTPRPLIIEAVTPPAIDTMQVDCRYPDYTGWNQSAETLVPVLGSEVSLPLGTEFELQVEVNKPLRSARIVSDFFEVEGDRLQVTVTGRDGYAVSGLSAGQSLVSVDGRSIAVRFRLVMSEGDASDTADASGSGEVQAAEGQGDASDSLSAAERNGIPLPSNSSLRFFLHDEDDVISINPETLRVRGVADQPPVVAVRASGVSNSVTRQARIPFAGLIQDDYGLVKAGFEFLVDDRTDWSPRPFENRFRPVMEYDLEADGGVGSEYFSVQLGDLTEGQTLAVSIVAVDNCTIPSSNRTRSEPVVFRIVSNEELLSLLYTREMSLRRRFEEVVQQLEEVRDDLDFHTDVAKRLVSDSPPASGDEEVIAAKRSEDRIAMTTCATRSGNQLRRQANELESIVEDFEEIAKELINNAIPPKQLAENMRSEIVTPLRQVTTDVLGRADRSVSRFRVAAAAGRDSAELIQVASADVSEAIVQLKQILESVRDMAELHEVLSDLKNILEEQQRIMEETKREQIRRLGF